MNLKHIRTNHIVGDVSSAPPPIEGCPTGTLYRAILTQQLNDSQTFPVGTVLCMTSIHGEQTATVQGTSTTVRVEPDPINTDPCPRGQAHGTVPNGPALPQGGTLTDVCLNEVGNPGGGGG